MSRITAALFFATCAIACTAAPAASAKELRVTFTAYGPVRIGMSPKAIEIALGAKLKRDAADADSAGCEYVASSRGYEGIGFMLINQRLARIDVSAPKVSTLSGARVGQSQEEVLALYPGRVKVSPHFYTAPDGDYLTMLSHDKKHGMRFETNHGKVTVYYAGTAEAIQYVEGCQ